jgi:cobaltochelatase CobN
VDNVVQASNTWKKESEVADVYFNRVGHFFGQGYWGERPGGKDLAVDIFKMALKDAKAAIHSRSSNVFATLDNDDVFQYLGATAMAIRQVNARRRRPSSSTSPTARAASTRPWTSSWAGRCAPATPIPSG